MTKRLLSHFNQVDPVIANKKFLDIGGIEDTQLPVTTPRMIGHCSMPCLGSNFKVRISH